MSHDTGVSPSHLGEHLPEEDVQEMADESKDLIQDQIIIAPEIMNLILDNLDFRTLKQVRLVCKSWLREAQTHMKRRGIVRFDRNTSTQRIWKFEQLRQNKMLSLPQPFHSLDLDLEYSPLTRVLDRFTRYCAAPLAVARFSAVSVGMKLTFRMIIEHTSTLEYLKLSRNTYKDGHVPRLPNGHKFPKLRHLVFVDVHGEDGIFGCKQLPRFVAGIVKGSPNLKTFECHVNAAEQEGRELLRAVDIRKVKTLNLDYDQLKQSAAEHLLSIPFSQLQNLKLSLYRNDIELTKIHIEAVKKCSATLKVLDLTSMDFPEDESEFPVCANVETLVLRTIPEPLNFISQYFPSLRVLEVSFFCIHGDSEEDVWGEQPLVPGLKTLRILEEYFEDQSDEFYVSFFEKLPGLECLNLSVHAILRCCRLKASGDARFSKMIEGLKYLEIQQIQGRYPKDCENDDQANDVDYSLLAALKV